MTYYIPGVRGKPTPSCEATFKRVVPRNLEAKAFMDTSLPELVEEEVYTEHCQRYPGHAGKHLWEPPKWVREEFRGLPQGWEYPAAFWGQLERDDIGHDGRPGSRGN